ncbi:MAG: tellurium resistance protein TerC [Alteromonadaceae bacterium]|nr:tellurium resistance protein TerC [Alteromonadaceae bacterium]
MLSNIKSKLITVLGLFFIVIGTIFVLLPGPAILFLPLGLALLSLEYPWAKVWLRKTQRWLRQGAVQTDKFAVWLGRRFNR